MAGYTANLILGNGSVKLDGVVVFFYIQPAVLSINLPDRSARGPNVASKVIRQTFNTKQKS